MLQRKICLLLLLHCRLFGSVVRGAYGWRAFEGHVFEHMCHARLALRILSGAGINMRIKREDWCFMPLRDDKGQSISQCLNLSLLLKRRNILGGNQRGKNAGKQRQIKTNSSGHGVSFRTTCEAKCSLKALSNEAGNRQSAFNHYARW